ncbi:MAG: protein kinase [Candidatus Eremiobacteraeota bacterium]|nr:protein kinase [Candidatus Eremiobacteraeota bacterium]
MKRVPAPDSDKSERTVLPEGSHLHGVYKVHYLGAGSRGVSYKAEKGNTFYHIKEVDTRESQLLFSLTQEHFILSRVSHPAIVKAFDFFEEEGFCYLVTELVRGESLDLLVAPGAPGFTQEKDAEEFASQLYDIFEYLHGLNPPVFYRDIKPRNIIKDREGKLRIVDFGTTGAPDDDGNRSRRAILCSPEHTTGTGRDARSDVFNLGATLHFLLTNGYERGRRDGVLLPVRSVNPDVSENLEKVIEKATHPDKLQRFQSVREMRMAHLGPRKEGALARSSGRGSEEEEAAAISPERKRLASVPLFMLLAGIFLLVLAGIFIYKGSRSSHRAAVSSQGHSEDFVVQYTPLPMKSTGPGPESSPPVQSPLQRTAIGEVPGSPSYPPVSYAHESAANPEPTASSGNSAPQPPDLPGGNNAPPLMPFSYPTGAPVKIAGESPVTHREETPGLPPSPAQQGAPSGNDERKAAEIISQILKVKEGDIQAPRGIAQGPAIELASPGRYYASLQVPKGYLQILGGVKFFKEDPRLRERIVEESCFAALDSTCDGKTLRLLQLTVLVVPVDVSPSVIYSIYLDGLRSQCAENLAFTPVRSGKRTGYAYSFHYTPLNSSESVKCEQLAFISDDGQKMYILSSSASPDIYKYYARDFSLFCQSLRQ